MERALQLLVCTLAAGVSGMVYLDFFATKAFLPAIGVTIVVAGAAALLVSRRGPVVSSVALLGLFPLVAVPFALRSTMDGWWPAASTARELTLGVAGGWARVLSVSVPAEPTGQILVAVLLAVWCTTFAAVLLVLRAQAALAPVAPLLLGFVAALVVVASRQTTHLAATVATAVLITLLVFLRTGNGSRVRTAAGATLFLVLAVGAGSATFGVVASGENRADPRPLRTDPIKPPDLITPLNEVRDQLIAKPPRVLFTARTTGADDLVGLRTATLGHFDGTLWTSDDEYLVAGERLAREQDGEVARQVTARVTLGELPPPFLPVVGRPSGIRFTTSAPKAIAFSAVSDSVLADQSWQAGTTYEVTGVQAVARDLGQDAVPTSSERYAAFREVPGTVPPGILTQTQAITDTASNAVDKLRAIETYLRGLPYSIDAPPGHSYARISRMLGSAQNGEDKGYAEQHAAAFALMARVLDYPARVAVGYRVRDQVTTADAHAWAEVHFAGRGWVAFDPTDPAKAQRDAPEQPKVTQVSAPVPTDGSQRPVQTIAPVPGDPLVEPARNVFWRVLLALAGFALLVVLLVPLEKARRRRRRRAGPAAAQVVGAWEEAVDRLLERDLALAPERTPVEYARYAQERFGPPANVLAEFAEITTTAIYGPDHLADGAAERTWGMARTLRRDLYPGWRRLLWVRSAIDPRPLYSRRILKRSRR
ncbi:DUF3488 and DUF4129 domain-containing transglutaminase family protein [Lentzea sp. NPDC092896]|uniref:transglutaminase TgpA family protein n=1 Tax=Lentzea sp. NPDC092896 TaxID=3364127 RepID=UPI0038251EAE